MASYRARLDAENSQLRALNSDLQRGEPAIVDEMARLEAVRDVCRGVKERYQVVVTEGEKRLEEMTARADVVVDEIVCSTTIVYNQ